MQAQAAESSVRKRKLQLLPCAACGVMQRLEPSLTLRPESRSLILQLLNS